MKRLIIKFLGQLEYDCVISEDLKKKRVSYDYLNYDRMIEEIIEIGRIRLTLNPDYDEAKDPIASKHIRNVIPVTNIDELFEVLKVDFEVELQEEAES